MEQQKRVVDDGNLFSWIQINKKYFRTAPGITKIIQVVLGILCLILASPAVHVSTLWFSYVIIIAIVVTVIWSFIYLLSAREAVSFPINWPLTEMLNMCFMAIIVAIATIFQLSHWIGARYLQECVRNVIAGVLGIALCVFYLIGAGLAYIEWRQTHTINSS
ncbi:uncharacterized protein LOC135833286 [Planococcus citri]|uniref:uncharacterized protein LOC135833286 n=1 Tax=Planococcus citri TaxID=170843 RepID=UPI0031F73876